MASARGDADPRRTASTRIVATTRAPATTTQTVENEYRSMRNPMSSGPPPAPAKTPAWVTPDEAAAVAGFALTTV